LHTSVILEGPGIGVGDWENRGNVTGVRKTGKERAGRGRSKRMGSKKENIMQNANFLFFFC